MKKNGLAAHIIKNFVTSLGYPIGGVLTAVTAPGVVGH
jgi:hypothetical protein